MVNLFIVFNFDHSYQKECLFLFLKKTPNHQVILVKAKKAFMLGFNSTFSLRYRTLSYIKRNIVSTNISSILFLQKS